MKWKLLPSGRLSEIRLCLRERGNSYTLDFGLNHNLQYLPRSSELVELLREKKYNTETVEKKTELYCSLKETPLTEETRAAKG